MVHNPKHKVHSFRGLLADGGQDEINLERQNVNLAYRVVKFELMHGAPGTINVESVVKIYRESQSSIDGIVNFTDTDLLGVAFLTFNASNPTYSTTETITFDNVLFSRNIFVTNKDVSANANTCNYYIELEEVPVGAATLMQLKLGTARREIGASMG